MSRQAANVGMFDFRATRALAGRLAPLERNVASRMCSAELFQIVGTFRLGRD
jgi:hypothetical protein